VILDTLVVELGLDPKKFTDGQRDALGTLRKLEEGAESQGRRIEAQTKRVNDVFQGFKREALSTLGLFVGGYGLKEMITNISNLDAQTGRFAKTLGVGTRELSNWQGLFKQIGADAGSAHGALGGINSALVNFALGRGIPPDMAGVLSQLGVDIFDKNRNLKTPTDLLLDVAGSIEKKHIDPRYAAGMLSGLPGMNQDMINALLLGRGKLESYLAEANRAGGTTDKSSKDAQDFQKNMGLLGTAATEAGRAVLEYLYKPLNAVAVALREIIELSPTAAGVFGLIAGTFGIGALGKKAVNFFRPAAGAGAAAGAGGTAAATAAGGVAGAAGRLALRAAGPAGILLGSTSEASAATMNPNWWDPYMGPGGAGTGGGTGTASEIEAYIRKAAVARGIDPDIAVKVWGSEGRAGYVGDKGSSFGPFQLHYGGIAPGMMQKGLGDEFTRRTGQDARDPATWRSQVDFSLDEARKSGWGQWYGWKGPAWAGIDRNGGGGTGGGTTSVNIGTINVNAPNAKDASGVAKEIGPQLRRQVTSSFANGGPQ
jgi:hypothetical protein